MVAVVGCGYWGKNLVREFAHLGALAAIVDERADVAEALARQYGVRALALEEVLRDSAIGSVAIATPAVAHRDVAMRAFRAGKHVYVEKPLALSVREGAELVATADRLGLTLMVGHLLQYHPAFLALKEFVAAGRLGRLSYLYSNRLSFGIIRREEDVLWSFAPHDLSMVLSLLGEEPERVSAFAAPTLHARLADFCQVQMTFGSGVRAHVFCSWLHPFKEQRLVVVGEKGMAVFEDSAKNPADKLKHYPHAVEWVDGAPRAVKAPIEVGVPIPYGDGNPLRDECGHFLSCVVGGTRPRTDGAEGLRVLSVLERASAVLNGKPDGGPVVARDTGTGSCVDPQAEVAASAFVHGSAYVDAGVKIGADTKIWHFSHILGSVEIGARCNIGQNVVVGPKVKVGNDVKIQNNVSVYEGVHLEDGVFCGPSCVFTNVKNPRAEIARKAEYRPTHVRRGATIGANATIVCGHEIGAYSFIAAGAVVAKDVPAFALMAGVPARRIGWMSRAGLRLGPNLVCPETGRRYREAGPDLLEEIA